DIHAYLRDLATQAGREDGSLRKRVAEVVRETALIAMLASEGYEDGPEDVGGPDADRALLLLRSHVAQYATYREWLKNPYRELFGAQFGLETASLTNAHKLHQRTDDWLLVTGKGAARLVFAEQGTHLFLDEGAAIAPLQAMVFPLGRLVSPRAAMAGQIR